MFLSTSYCIVFALAKPKFYTCLSWVLGFVFCMYMYIFHSKWSWFSPPSGLHENYNCPCCVNKISIAVNQIIMHAGHCCTSSLHLLYYAITIHLWPVPLREHRVLFGYQPCMHCKSLPHQFCCCWGTTVNHANPSSVASHIHFSYGLHIGHTHKTAMYELRMHQKYQIWEATLASRPFTHAGKLAAHLSCNV